MMASSSLFQASNQPSGQSDLAYVTTKLSSHNLDKTLIDAILQLQTPNPAALSNYKELKALLENNLDAILDHFWRDFMSDRHEPRFPLYSQAIAKIASIVHQSLANRALKHADEFDRLFVFQLAKHHHVELQKPVQFLAFIAFYQQNDLADWTVEEGNSFSIPNIKNKLTTSFNLLNAYAENFCRLYHQTILADFDALFNNRDPNIMNLYHERNTQMKLALLDYFQKNQFALNEENVANITTYLCNRIKDKSFMNPHRGFFLNLTDAIKDYARSLISDRKFYKS